MRYVIRHQTRLAFRTPVREHHCELRVAPIDDDGQRRRSLRLVIEPAAHLHPYVDVFGNLVHAFDVLAPHGELVTLLETEVETARPGEPREPLASSREDAWIADALRAHPPLWDFVVHRSDQTPELSRLFPRGGGDLEAPVRNAGTTVLEAVDAVMTWARAVLDHAPGGRTSDAPLATAVAAGAGDCQDFAHLVVTVVRSWGIPARYVSGYLDPGHSTIAGPDDPATHAWAEVLVPAAGWRGVDAVNGRLADDTYVRVAIGRDRRDVAPRRGTYHGSESREAPEVRLAITRQYQQ
jgi:transglutaminase-like putative cysteine protease